MYMSYRIVNWIFFCLFIHLKIPPKALSNRLINLLIYDDYYTITEHYEHACRNKNTINTILIYCYMYVMNHSNLSGGLRLSTRVKTRHGEAMFSFLCSTYLKQTSGLLQLSVLLTCEDWFLFNHMLIQLLTVLTCISFIAI